MRNSINRKAFDLKKATKITMFEKICLWFIKPKIQSPAFLEGYFSVSLQEHKQVIRDLMETYIIDLNQDGSPKKSITEIMNLIDRAVKLVSNDR